MDRGTVIGWLGAATMTCWAMTVVAFYDMTRIEGRLTAAGAIALIMLLAASLVLTWMLGRTVRT